ncbi:hypothetical protein OUZ56_028873 [Daphnia magna]|uniref:Uncharacterized protein n=1 Tax=Daphnia magna TaxID=35525 RepID=A0ABR0B577_9CRUS|nr:hypothetical protein OUZ56_028873 [Daphnia magna]
MSCMTGLMVCKCYADEQKLRPTVDMGDTWARTHRCGSGLMASTHWPIIVIVASRALTPETTIERKTCAVSLLDVHLCLQRRHDVPRTWPVSFRVALQVYLRDGRQVVPAVCLPLAAAVPALRKHQQGHVLRSARFPAFLGCKGKPTVWRFSFVAITQFSITTSGPGDGTTLCRRDDVNGEGEDLMLARLRFSFVLVGLSPVVCLYGLLRRRIEGNGERTGRMGGRLGKKEREERLLSRRANKNCGGGGCASGLE